MLRPASPKEVPLGLPQVPPDAEEEDGEQKAAVLNHSAVVGLLSGMGAPVTSGRGGPVAARLNTRLVAKTAGRKVQAESKGKVALPLPPPKMCDQAPFW